MSDSFATPWTIACQVPQSMGFHSKNTGCCFTVAKLCLTLCNPMNCSTPGFPVLHHLPLFKLMSIESVCHPTISSSVTPISTCPQSFPASGSFPMNRFFTLGGPKYWGFSNSPSNEYSGLVSFRSDWFDLKGLSRVFTSTKIQKHQFFGAQPSLWSNSHI